jgi:hypothetical protein
VADSKSGLTGADHDDLDPVGHLAPSLCRR